MTSFRLANAVDRTPRLKVAPESVKRLKEKLQLVFRGGRGRRLDRFIQELNPVIRGWVAYFRISDVRVSFEELDGWIHRKLRCLLWRQWKRPRTRPGEAHRTWFERGTGERFRLQWSRPLVERRCLAHESGHSYPLFKGSRSLELPRGASGACLFFLNRRVRNRTHGAVGAGGGQPPPAT
jgi:hypothetical protein